MNNVLVGQFGGNSVALPMHSFGTGHPVSWVITGIHGNEASGLLVINQLMKLVKAHPKAFRGTINILSVANPLAQITNTRWHPIDHHDLNRSFPGKMNGEPTQHLAAVLLNLLKSADRVVDIHNFILNSPVTGVIVSTNQKTFAERTKNWISGLPIECLWTINPNQTNQGSYVNSLGQTLNQIGVTNIVIELPPSECLSETTASSISAALLKSLSAPLVPKRNKKRSDSPMTITNRIKIVSPTSGLFIASGKKLMEMIEKDDVLGRVIEPLGITEIPVTSRSSGVLHGLKQSGLVRQGEVVAAIGEVNQNG